MFAHCMFCNRSLGTNEVIEEFPVGRRLAFDSDRGRLWVVCGRCERWNLSPMEERWEAVEACERLFRETRVRTSTDQIGLARLREGLELVRIGQPLRPEFAAWRYGDQFGRRRKRAIIYGAAGISVFGVVVFGGAALGILSGAVLAQSGTLVNAWQNGRTLARLRPDDGRVIKLKNPDLLGTRLRPGAEPGSFRLEVRKGKKKEWFEGDEARRLAGAILPAMNRGGARQPTVQDAVDEIERRRHPEAFMKHVASSDGFRDKHDVPGYVNKMPKPVKLAVEMALHEEQERRALEGELRALEAAWQRAEEIAEISDSLLLPEGTEAFLEKHRKGEKWGDGTRGDGVRESGARGEAHPFGEDPAAGA